MDTIAYGYSQRVLKKWPGTFVIPLPTFIDTVTNLLLSLSAMGFRKVALVSTHGNHPGALRVVARQVADECGMGPGLFFPTATAFSLLEEHGSAGPGGSCHAGEFETSVMLHLSPELVDMDAAGPGDKIRDVSPYSSSEAFVSTWTRQESASGAYGDPTCATAALGKLLFDKMVDETAGFIRYYHGLKQV